MEIRRLPTIPKAQLTQREAPLQTGTAAPSQNELAQSFSTTEQHALNFYAAPSQQLEHALPKTIQRPPPPPAEQQPDSSLPPDKPLPDPTFEEINRTAIQLPSVDNAQVRLRPQIPGTQPPPYTRNNRSISTPSAPTSGSQELTVGHPVVPPQLFTQQQPDPETTSPFESRPPNKSLPPLPPEEIAFANLDNPATPTLQNRRLPQPPSKKLIRPSSPLPDDSPQLGGVRPRSDAHGRKRRIRSNSDPVAKSLSPTASNPVKPHRPFNETPLQFVKKCTVVQQNITQLQQFFCEKVAVYAPFEKVNGDFSISEYLEQVRALNLLLPKTASTQLLNSRKVQKEFIQLVKDIRVISKLKTENAYEVAFNRDIVHTPPFSLSTMEQNQAMLGCDGSAIRLGKNLAYIQPNGQVSILMRTPIQDKNGEIVYLHVVSVSAPALDDTKFIVNLKSEARPEMEIYLVIEKNSITLHTINYGIAHDTLATHIFEAALLSKAKRVVFSGFGVNNFINTLAEIDKLIEEDRKFNEPAGAIDDQTKDVTKTIGLKDTALEIAATSLAKLIIRLRGKKIAVCFSDVYQSNNLTQGFKCKVYWEKVNAVLKSFGAEPLNPVNGNNSALGDDWAEIGDLIVNAWDPDSLTGNGLLMDLSFDGFLGIMTIIHALHAAGCQWYVKKLLQNLVK